MPETISITGLLKDIQFALRQLAARPGFSAIAVLVLALGLGANAAIFSVVNAVLLQPLPYPHPETLVGLFERDVVGDSEEDHLNSVSPALFEDWQANAHSIFLSSAVRATSFNISSKSQSFNPERINGIACSPTFTRILGIQPAIGRFFTAAEDQYQSPYVAVLSYRFWQKHFGGASNVLAQQVRLDGNNYSILGVLPKEFVFQGQPADVFVPFKRTLDVSNRTTYSNHFFDVIGRLAPGYSAASAQEELSNIARNSRRAHPNEIMGKAATVVTLNSYLVRNVKTALLVLLCAVGCLLLIACVNIANLLLTRALGRQRELAIRIAVGASRFQIVRQLLIESTMLSFLGAAAGLFVASWTSSFLATHAPGADDLPQTANIQIDGPVLLFTTGIALLSGLAAGLFPALAASRTDLVTGLKETGRSNTSSRSHGRLRDILVGLEVAVSLVLLVAAGLLLHSFLRMQDVSPGFRTENSISFEVSLPDATYKNRQTVSNFVGRLAQELRGMPGASSAGLVSYPPLAGHWNDTVFHIKGHPLPPRSMMDLLSLQADPGYFRAVGIPLLRGRFFTAQDGVGYDEKHPHLGKMIISEATAKKFFPALDPMGQIMELGTDSGLPPDPSGNPYPEFQIVGIVGDVPTSAEKGIEPAAYRPLLDGDESHFYGVVHTTGDPLLLRSGIESVVHRLDADLPVNKFRTFAQINTQQTRDRRFSASLLVLFAGVALLLAAIGLYGVVSYAVTQRTAEIGIRIALGASRTAVSRLILLDGMKPAVLGLLAGILASVALSQVLKSLLFGISALDGITFIAVPLILAATVAVACLVPALRATRIDPTVALRSE
ncbi:MAG TPA: ABC transporter permease [Bryobacteraceae bacterium]|nr:ABC transporter permease [Bryobacteraceae bacterium]